MTIKLEQDTKQYTISNQTYMTIKLLINWNTQSNYPGYFQHPEIVQSLLHFQGDFTIIQSDYKCLSTQARDFKYPTTQSRYFLCSSTNERDFKTNKLHINKFGLNTWYTISGIHNTKQNKILRH